MASTTAAPPRVGLRIRVRSLIIFIVVVIILVVAGNFGYQYWLDSTLYVTSDDALVDSNMVAVVAPGSGTLTTWNVKLGNQVHAGEIIGTIFPPSSAAATRALQIIAPQDGTLLRVDGKTGQFVGASQPLAYVANLDQMTITAYIDETAIHKVKPGQQVDVTVDALGSTVYLGRVKEIIPAAAGEFSILPTTDRTTANFTKVVQRIEVHIDLGSTANANLYPGESAYVRIHI
jgi:multidrug resistance efflux pump